MYSKCKCIARNRPERHTGEEVGIAGSELALSGPQPHVLQVLEVHPIGVEVLRRETQLQSKVLEGRPDRI